MKRVGFLIYSVTLFVFAGLAMAQNDPIVYITKSGSKYHKAGCGYLKKSNIPIKLSEVGNRYTPCSRCNPPKAIQKDESIKDKATTKNEINKNKVYTDEDLSTYAPPASSKSTSMPGEKYSTGKTIYTGPRGGRYYYSPSGKKVYLKKK